MRDKLIGVKIVPHDELRVLYPFLWQLDIMRPIAIKMELVYDFPLAYLEDYFSHRGKVPVRFF